MSMFSRDDEQPNPWTADLLGKTPVLATGGDCPFYAFAQFRALADQPLLAFPPRLLLSDNFFKPRWVGVGERRLKNAELVLEWVPQAGQLVFRQLVARHFQALCAQGLPANAAAGQAMVAAREQLRVGPPVVAAVPCGEHYVGAVSLAEGETLRRLIHLRHPVLASAGMRLRRLDGSLLDQSEHMNSISVQDGEALVSDALLCLRFVNNDMFYTDTEIDRLNVVLGGSGVPERVHFFEGCLRLRRRERNRWADTPLARVLTERDRWHALPLMAKLEQFNAALRARPTIDLVSIFSSLTGEGHGAVSCTLLQRAFEALHLGFAPRDIAQIITLADPEAKGVISWEQFLTCFPSAGVAREKAAVAKGEDGETLWQCENCTFLNSMRDRSCAMCSLGWSGEREVPAGKWMCTGPGNEGGCTLFNPNSMFYCEACGRCRPDLSSVRF